jgi:hypothetical protein
MRALGFDNGPETDAARFDDIESLLTERGHDLASGRIRVAAGRSGVAVGFPQKPLIHISWWAFAGIVLVVGVKRRHRRA